MRSALIFGVAFAALLSDVRASEAYYYAQGPWCAVQSLGFGTVQRNCRMRSFEECRLEVIAGNRGTCEPNAYWTGPQPPAGKPIKRKRRARY